MGLILWPDFTRHRQMSLELKPNREQKIRELKSDLRHLRQKVIRLTNEASMTKATINRTKWRLLNLK